MKKLLHIFLIVSVSMALYFVVLKCFGRILDSGPYVNAAVGQADLGIGEMELGAGAKSMKPPKRRNIVKINSPAELNKSATEYILQKDVVADGTAFTITADNVTLNLNGHIVIYNNKKLDVDPKSVYGILIPRYGQKNIAIVNGTIKQGLGGGSGNVVGWGHNPIFAEGVENLKISGIIAVYGGRDIVGFFIHWGKNAHIHHNTIEDKGTHITNRHQGLDAIRIEGANAKIHHNLIKRCRHRAITIANNTEVYNNEIYIDSHATNSYGVMCYGTKSFSIHHNKIFGVGEHPVGVGATSGSSNGEIYSNYIKVQNTRRSAEYGSTGSACIRMIWGTHNTEVHHNTLIVHAENNYSPGFDSWGRAIWAGLPKPEQKAVFHDNVIIATNKDGKAKAAAIAIVCNNESPHLIFRNNKVISNWSNVLLADRYGHANGYARFVANTFVRQDDYSNYRTIRSQYSYVASTGVFINNKFENGASLESIDLEFNGKGKKEIAVGWFLDILVADKFGKPVNEVALIIKDNSGNVVFEGKTNEKGGMKTTVIEYLLTNTIENEVVHKIKNYIAGKGDRVSKTPHTIVISKNGQSVTKSVKVTGNKTIRIVF